MSGPKNPRDVHVDVILNSETPGDFVIQPRPPLQKGSNGELIFQNAGFPGFFVHFHLKDNTGLDYQFPPQPKINEAAWSELGAGSCPQTPGKWEVFNPRNVMNNGMTLVVQNANPNTSNPPGPPKGQGPFGYTLRVTKNGGLNYLELDPGGDNQNGPISRFDWETVTAAAIAGGVAAIGAAFFVSSQLEPSSALLFGVGGAVVGLIIGVVVGRF